LFDNFVAVLGRATVFEGARNSTDVGFGGSLAQSTGVGTWRTGETLFFEGVTARTSGNRGGMWSPWREGHAMRVWSTLCHACIRPVHALTFWLSTTL